MRPLTPVDLPVAALVVAALVSSPAIAARDRLAVLLTADDDPALADNLTEVAISTLAKRRDRDLVGTRELRSQLANILPDGGLEPCLTQPDCLAAIATASGADRAVFGVLRPAGDRVTLALALVDLRNGVAAARFSRTAARDVDELIATLNEGLATLVAHLPPTVAPVAPIATAAIAGPGLTLADRSEARGGRSAALVYVGIGAAALAAISFSGAIVRGNMAVATLTGDTRAEMQADLARRNGYGDTANALWITGALLSAVAAGALAWWLRAAKAKQP